MKRKFILLLFVLIFISGCENREEAVKNEYIAMRNQAFSPEEYTDKESLPVDIVTTVERINEESVNYKIVINEPKENMHNVKVMVVHNCYNEDVFPSIGVFDETKELLVDNSQELVLKDSIKTTDNISKLNLELKIFIEFVDDFGKIRKIYYKAT